MAEDVTRSLMEQLEAQRAAIQQKNRELEDQVGNAAQTSPHVLTRQNDLSDPKAIGIIYQWDAGDGIIIYTRQGIGNSPLSPDQILVLSKKITAQRNLFNGLSETDQSGIITEFNSSGGKAESTRLYGDFLQSETLGEKFQKLQQ